MNVFERDPSLDRLKPVSFLASCIDRRHPVNRFVQLGSTSSSFSNGFHLGGQHGHTETTDKDGQEDGDDLSRVDAVSIDLGSKVSEVC
jgi:hypothetical protein